jgi:cell division protease FtsH
VLKQLSTGAANDLATATDLATRMVREFGLSEQLGPVGYHSEEEPGGLPGMHGRPYAEQTQRSIDAEVERLLREAESRAQQLLEEHRDGFDELVDRLLDAEVVDGSEVYELLGRPAPDSH